MSIDGALLLALALLLPFRLLPFAARFFPPTNASPSPPAVAAITTTARSAALFLAVGILVTAAFDSSDGRSSENAAMVAEVQQLKAKTAQLEFFLQESHDALNAKAIRFEDKEKIFKEMEQKIQILQNDLHELKGAAINLLHSEERIRALEEEVQHLLDQSRKNIQNINVLEALADDGKEKLDISAAHVEKMESIVTEQWIQIQQLEQAFQLTKIMTARVLKRNSHNSHGRGQTPGMHIMAKVQQFLRSISRQKVTNTVNLPDSFFLGAFSWSCISLLQKIANSIMSLIQNFHYELQELVRNSLEINEFTASVSNELVVNILAYAILAIPVFSGWFALLFFSDDEEDV